MALTTKDVARILNVTPARVRQFAQSGALVGTKIGRDWLFQKNHVQAFTRKQRKAGRPRKYHDEYIWNLALHEAGHAVVSLYLRNTGAGFTSVSIEPGKDFEGRVLLRKRYFPTDPVKCILFSESEATVALSGPVAELFNIYKERRQGMLCDMSEEEREGGGWATDFKHARYFVDKALEFGFGFGIDIESREAFAWNYIQDLWPHVETVAQRLCNERHLSFAELESSLQIEPDSL